jgi:hypothetical protein
VLIATREMNSIINSIERHDDVINDVINLILNTTSLTIQQLIDEINKSKFYGCLYIKNEDDLISYIKGKSTLDLLLRPIDCLLYWNGTTKGHDFYSKANQIIKRSSKLYHIYV